MLSLEASLPSDFLRWLENLPEIHVVQYKDNEWQFWTPQELKESTLVNKVSIPQFSLLTAFVAMYRAMGLTSAKGPAAKPFLYDRLERCLTLATDNEDYLIVDPDDSYSVWKFCPDYAKCGEVKPIAASLSQFMEGSRVESLDEDADNY